MYRIQLSKHLQGSNPQTLTPLVSVTTRPFCCHIGMLSTILTVSQICSHQLLSFRVQRRSWQCLGGYRLKYLGNWPCCSMHNLHQDRCEDREGDEKVRQLSHSLAKKKIHNLKVNSGCQRWLEHLDLHNTCLFSESVATTFAPPSVRGKPGLI